MLKYILKIEKHYYDANNPDYSVYPANFNFITHSKLIDIEVGLKINTDDDGIKELYRSYSHQDEESKKLITDSVKHKVIDTNTGEVKYCTSTTYVHRR